MLGSAAPGGGVGPERKLKRRRFLVSAGLASTGAALGSCPVGAQAAPRVGFLISGDPEPTTSQFRAAMAEVGYVEGRTIRIEYRSADPASGKLTEYAAELARLKLLWAGAVPGSLGPITPQASASSNLKPSTLR